MEIAIIVVALVALLAVGVLFRTIRQRDEVARQRDEAAAQRDEANRQIAALEARHATRLEEVEKARAGLETHFKGLASEIFNANSEELLKQAKARFEDQRQIGNQDLDKRQQAITNLLEPIRKNLEKFETRVNEIEEKREGAYQGLLTQVGQLQGMAQNLGEALRSPQIRGLWGEQQLRNILELAGMREHIDFFEQSSHAAEGGTIRPDAVVRVPGGVQVVIDAKTPLDSYLDAHNTSDNDERRAGMLEKHANSLLGHARTLKDKNYGSAVEGSPDFVVMFVPADPILDAAMDVRPTLWQEAWEKHQVLIATPGLLLAFLKTVALAWQQQDMQENAQKIADLGKDLYDSLQIYSGHVDDMGKGLTRAVNAYNSSIGSLERRVLPRARRFEELGPAATKQFDAPSLVDLDVRPLVAPELTEDKDPPQESATPN